MQRGGHAGLWAAAMAATASALLVGLALYGDVTWIGLLAVGLIQPINLASLLFSGLRSQTLTGGGVNWWVGAKGASISASLLYILPGRLSELARPIYFSEQSGLPLIRGIALLSVERFMDLVIVAAVAAASMLLFAAPELEKALMVLVALIAVGCAGGFTLFRWPQLLNRAVNLLPGRIIRDHALRLLAEIRSTVAPGRLLMALGWGLLTWLASYLLVYVLLNLAASEPISLLNSLFVFLAGTVGLSIAVAPGGLGTFETGIVVALKVIGYSIPEALSLSLLLRAANLGVVPLLAVWAVAQDGVGLKGLIDRLKALRNEDVAGRVLNPAAGVAADAVHREAPPAPPQPPLPPEPR